MKPGAVTTLFLFFAFLILNNAMEIPEHLKKHAKKLHKRCQNQSGTSDEVIKSSLSGVLPKEENFPCYVHCLFDIMGIMDGSKIIHLENLLQVLPEEMHSILNMLAEKCGTKDGNDNCEIAYNTMQCYADNNPHMLSDELEFLFD